MLTAIILVFIGLGLIYLEFFLPGGIVALFGGLCVVSGVTLFSTQDVPTMSKILFFLGSALFVALTCKWAIWIIKHRRKEEFLLNSDQEGYVASSFDKDLIGHFGEAASDLKPSGHILVDGKRFQAVSEALYIIKGSKVEITSGRGGYLIVRACRQKENIS